MSSMFSRFEAEVELLDDRLREQLDERGRVRERGDRDAADEARREPRHRRDVFADEPRDLRPLHLDDDLFAGAQPRRVHLRDRRGRDRRAVERLEHVVERAAELELDHAAHVVERLGRHPVAQQLELGDQLLGEQAFAARDDLAELDVGRAERARTRWRSRRERPRRRARRPLAPVDRRYQPPSAPPTRPTTRAQPAERRERGRSPASAGTRRGPAPAGGRRRRATSSRRDRRPTARGR